MKAKRAECIRKAINISSQKDFFKFDKSSFNPIKVKDALPITSPKLMELINNINELDKNDFDKYGTYFKHIIYSDVKASIAGIKLVASALTAYGMTNIYDKSLNVKIPEGNHNFALLSSLPVYDKQTFPIKLRKKILDEIFNARPDNIYGKNIRFLLIDSGFKEGIDVYDVKYIHLVDDLISKSDETQAIGRGTRHCGQKGLTFNPELGWPLHVFKYKLMVDEAKYGHKDAFELYIKETGIDVNKLKFSADLENICRFGAVDYEINKAIHEFGYEKEDNLKSKEIFNYYENFKDFKLIDPYLSLEKNNNNDFKLLKQAYLNFGGNIQKKTKKFINIKKIKPINLNYKMDFLTMRLFIRKNFSHLKWTNVELKNDCIKDKENKKENRIITLGNSQEFVSNFFTSSSLYKGILFWHSVGTGKTCSAIATASNSFEKDNYTILWVTRHSLKPEVWKNVFKLVCSHTIKEKLNKGVFIPEEPDGTSAKLKFVDNKWIEPISYKQFTNLINKKNEYYNEMIKRNGTEDPFKKTLIIIDEAHKLYAEDTPANEKPDINALKKAIYNSYKISGKDSCKLILMSATPYTTDPMQLFKLLNLLREDDFFPENFEDLKKEYLDLETYKFNKSKEFLDKITGYISYLNREKDVRQFAYPVIYIKEVDSNTNGNLNFKKSYDIINDYIEDIEDYLSNNNNIEKSKEMIKNLKNLTKKSKKTDDIISPQDAIDLCLSTNTKKTEIQDENLIKFNDLIKKFGDILKHKENDLKKKRKR